MPLAVKEACLWQKKSPQRYLYMQFGVGGNSFLVSVISNISIVFHYVDLHRDVMGNTLFTNGHSNLDADSPGCGSDAHGRMNRMYCSAGVRFQLSVWRTL
jgi:hypothetical protein